MTAVQSGIRGRLIDLEKKARCLEVVGVLRSGRGRSFNLEALKTDLVHVREKKHTHARTQAHTHTHTHTYTQTHTHARTHADIYELRSQLSHVDIQVHVIVTSL